MNKEKMGKVLDALKMLTGHYWIADAEKALLSEAIQILQDATAQPVQPAKRVPLTVEQIDTAMNSIQALYWDVPTNSTEDFVRAIEVTHGIVASE